MRTGEPHSPAAKLMREIIRLSPYRKGLGPLAEDIVRIALANRQISEALLRAVSRNAASVTGPTRRQLGPDAALFMSFLEHVYYASPGFLASVGEGPASDEAKEASHGR